MPSPLPTAADVRAALHRLGDPVRAKLALRYFKSGPGQYGDGDKFIGVAVPAQRLVARRFRLLSLPETKLLLASQIHEERLTALLLMVYQYENGTPEVRRNIFQFYLDHTEFVNNWDLVDSSASYIVGSWLQDKDKTILEQLAQSKSIWERRIAIIATLHYIRAGQFDHTVRIAKMLLNDPHDLIHKATGWMLREVGKRDEATLRRFLAEHYHDMPRTTLRYAIEKFDPQLRQKYLKGDI